MKRVLSIRIAPERLAQCFDIVERLGNEKPSLGGAVAGALESMLFGLEQLGELRKYSAEQADARIGSPRAEGAVPTRQPFQYSSPLMQHEREKTMIFDDPVQEPEPPNISTELVDEVDRRTRLRSIIEEQMGEHEREEDEELAAILAVEGRAEAPAEAEPQATQAPWAGKIALGEADKRLEKDALWLLASKTGALAQLAVRIIYHVLPREMWSSEKALVLFDETYAKFKKWEDAHEGK